MFNYQTAAPAYGFINPSKMHRTYQSDYSAPPNSIK